MSNLYRKKPVVIEAIRPSDSSGGDAIAWLNARLESVSAYAVGPGQWAIDPNTGGVFIGTLEGTMLASPGDWVIEGVQGEVYPCKPDIFAATYEAVND